MKLTIDPEFQALIPPLAPDKFAGLEAEILATGGPTDPIIVWPVDGQHVIVDGHNRFAICQKHGLPYQVSTKTFFDRAAVKEWMLGHQLNRRNVSDAQLCMLAAEANVEPPGPRLKYSADYDIARSLVGTPYAKLVISGERTLRQALNQRKRDAGEVVPKPRNAIVPKAPTGWGSEGVAQPGFTAAAKSIAMEHGDPPVLTLLDRFIAAARELEDMEKVCQALNLSLPVAEDLLAEAKAAGYLFRFGPLKIAHTKGPCDPKPALLGRGTADIRKTGVGHTIIICDPHFPYHDSHAWEVALAAIEAVKPERVVCTGDGFDCYACSRFCKDPMRKHRLVDELELGGAELRRLMKAAGPDCSFVYCGGNHEDRIDRLLMDVPALHGMTSAKDQVQKYLPGCEWVPYRNVKRLGKVVYTHELGFAGKYAAQHTLAEAGTNVIFGHSHRASLVVDGDHTGDRRFCLNGGWLGDIKQVDYTHDIKVIRHWATGISHVYECPDTGLLWPSFVPIMRGRCFIAGQAVSI